MKERIYQGTIAGLVVVASVAFYNLYKKDDILKESQEMTLDMNKSIDLRELKPTNQNVDYKDLLLKQQKIYTSKSLQLSSKLSELNASTQSSINMIKDYNLKNQNNHLSINEVDLDSLSTKPFKFKELQTNLNIDQIKNKIQDIDNKVSNDYSREETMDIDAESESSNNKTTYNSFLSRGTSSTTSSNSTSIDTTNINTTTSPTIVMSSNDDSRDSDITKYRASINDITKVIEQINENLN